MSVTIQNLVKGESDWHLKINSNNQAIVDALNNVDSTTTFAKQSDLEATNSKLDDAVNPLTVSLSINPATAETGGTVNSTVLTWTCSKNIASQTFEGASIDPTLRTETYTTALTDDKTFTVTATTAGGTTITKTAKLDFCNGIYYGNSSKTTYDSTLISSLTKVLSDTKSRTITVNAGSGEYIYYCLPSRLGVPSFSVSGFTGGFTKVATINYKNPSGYTESYDIYKSDMANLGSTTVAIA
jgi:hypothetical protein